MMAQRPIVVFAVFSLLEHELRQHLELRGLDSFVSRSSLMTLLDVARSKEVLSPKELNQIRAHVSVRNKIAHTRGEVSAQQARAIVREVSAAVAKVREANLTRRRSSGPPTAAA